MTKLILILCMTLVMTGAGVLMWKAEATPLTGTAGSLAVTKSYSAVQEVGCMFGTRRCPPGCGQVEPPDYPTTRPLE